MSTLSFLSDDLILPTEQSLSETLGLFEEPPGKMADSDVLITDDESPRSSPVKVKRGSQSTGVDANDEEQDYREEQIDVLAQVKRENIKCTSCGKKCWKLEETPIHVHPLLRVIICKECSDYYNDGAFSLDEDGTDKYCRWCGEGGAMFCCTTCTFAFCKSCVRRNLSHQFCRDVDAADTWSCFKCDVKPLWGLRAQCWDQRRREDEARIRRKERGRRTLELLREKTSKPQPRRTIRKHGGSDGSTDEDARVEKRGVEKRGKLTAVERVKKVKDSSESSDDSDEASTRHGRSRAKPPERNRSTKNVENGKKKKSKRASSGSKSESDEDERNVAERSSRKVKSSARAPVAARNKDSDSSDDSDFEDARPKRHASQQKEANGPASASNSKNGDRKVSRSKRHSSSSSDRDSDADTKRQRISKSSNRPGPASSKRRVEEHSTDATKSKSSNRPGPASSKRSVEEHSKDLTKSKSSNRPGPASSKRIVEEDSKDSTRSKSNRPGPASSKRGVKEPSTDDSDAELKNKASSRPGPASSKSKEAQRRKQHSASSEMSDTESKSERRKKNRVSKTVVDEDGDSKTTRASGKTNSKPKHAERVNVTISETDSDDNPRPKGNSVPEDVGLLAADVDSDVSLSSAAEEEARVEMAKIAEDLAAHLRNLAKCFELSAEKVTTDFLSSKKSKRNRARANSKLSKVVALAQGSLDKVKSDMSAKNANFTKRVIARAKRKPKPVSDELKTGSQLDRECAEYDRRMEERQKSRAVDSSEDEREKRHRSRKRYRHDDSPKPTSGEEEATSENVDPEKHKKKRTKTAKPDSSSELPAAELPENMSDREVNEEDIETNANEESELNASLDMFSQEDESLIPMAEKINSINNSPATMEISPEGERESEKNAAAAHDSDSSSCSDFPLASNPTSSAQSFVDLISQKDNSEHQEKDPSVGQDMNVSEVVQEGEESVAQENSDINVPEKDKSVNGKVSKKADLVSDPSELQERGESEGDEMNVSEVVQENDESNAQETEKSVVEKASKKAKIGPKSRMKSASNEDATENGKSSEEEEVATRELPARKAKAGPKSRTSGRNKSETKDEQDSPTAKELARQALLASDSNSSDSEQLLPKTRSTKSKKQTKPGSSDSESDSKLTKKVRRKRKEAGTSKPKKSQIDLSAYDGVLSKVPKVVLCRLNEDDYSKYNVAEPATNSSDDSDTAFRRLTNLSTLRRNVTRKRSGASQSAQSGSSGSEAEADASAATKKAVHKRKAKGKASEPKLADFLDSQCQADGDAATDESQSDTQAVDDLEAKKKKEVFLKRKCVKQQLLEDEFSDDVESNNNDKDSDEEVTKKTKKKVSDEKTEDKEGTKKKKKSAAKESDGDSAKTSDGSDDSAKRAKKKWRANKLLRGKLDLTDSSEDEKRWKDNKEKREKKKDEKEKKTGGSSDDSENNDDEEEVVKISSSVKSRKKRRNKVASESDSSILELLSSDSDDDFVVKKKKPKKRKNAKDSDYSSEDSDKPKKVKRKRIKAPKDSSDSDNDDKDGSEKGTPGKGRKNIRKVMKEESVGEMTRRAAKEEADRKKRIDEKQKLYNQIYSTGTPEEKKLHLDKLVLDFDPDTKEELVSVHPKIVKKLKPHQVKGVKFMWDACYESVKQLKKTPGSGCILAHCMGLGKTFQVVTLVHTLLNNPKTKVNTVLVVCPLNTVLNWVNEFQIWLKDMPDTDDINVYELSKFKAGYERKSKLMEWQEDGGVMCVNYEMYRSLSAGGNKKLRKNIQEAYIKCLVDPGPDLVVCDEGHLLKNEDSAISKAMNKIKTLRRIVLTGTPLQNNLKEYHCMVQFIKPNLLGTSKEFLNRFANPITNGQYENSTPHDVKVMKRRAHVLHKMLEGSVQRYDYNELTPFLPEKQEYVIYIRLTPVQISMYQHYLDKRSGNVVGINGPTLFPDFQQFQRICTHPLLMKWHSEVGMEKQREKENSDSEGSLRDFIDDDDDEESSSEDDDDDSGGGKKRPVKKSTRRLRGQPEPSPEPEPEVVPEEQPSEAKNDLEWWKEFCTDDDLDDMSKGGKLMFLFSMLRECEKIGDKILVFSQHLNTLNVIEEFLQLIDEETQKKNEDDPRNEKIGNHRGSWSKNIDYFRLDGGVTGENRHRDCKLFNNPNNERARLFLISTRAGGLGINLVGANRVIIFDACWNPSLDVQSIFRVFRFGQKKPCYIYRLLAYGTMEEKIYERQITKLALSCRVVDEQQIERYYLKSDREALYIFEPFPKPDRPTFNLPKDRMLADLLKEHERYIETYLEHDSLLENKEEEELNEEERKAAWEDYEEDKKGRAAAAAQQSFLTPDQIVELAKRDPLMLDKIIRQSNPLATDEQVKEHMDKLIRQLQAQRALNERIQQQYNVQQANFYAGQMPYQNAQANQTAAGIQLANMQQAAMQARMNSNMLPNVYQNNQYLKNLYQNPYATSKTPVRYAVPGGVGNTYPTGMYANKGAPIIRPRMAAVNRGPTTIMMQRTLQPSGINAAAGAATPAVKPPAGSADMPRIKVRNLENLQAPRVNPAAQPSSSSRIVTNPLYAGAAAARGNGTEPSTAAVPEEVELID